MTQIESTTSAGAGHSIDAAPSHGAVSLVLLFAVRGGLAIAWAAAFATVDEDLTGATGVLLVLYPLLDVVASLLDTRSDHGARAGALLPIGAALSAVAAVSLAIAATGDIDDVLVVFGTWALLSGLVQLVVALRRRSELGIQWPMLIAGTLSALVGVNYYGVAAGDDPMLDLLVAYAGAGGAFFVAQAAILAWRERKSVDPSAV